MQGPTNKLDRVEGLPPNCYTFKIYCVFHISLSQAFWQKHFFYTFLYISELKLTRYVSTVFIQLEMEFQLDRTEDKEFPHRPPL